MIFIYKNCIKKHDSQAFMNYDKNKNIIKEKYQFKKKTDHTYIL